MTEAVKKLTVEQYHDLIRDGVLTDDDPVEFLHGWLVTKLPKKPPHVLATQMGSAAQDPITLTDSEPEPDISVVRGEPRDYGDRHPGPLDVGLVVEVADTSLQRDRTTKLSMFAADRIPVYWIVNLLENLLEVYTDPTGPGPDSHYRHTEVLQPSDTVRVSIDGKRARRLAVRDLLP